jgi:exopolyphosphatase/guanosine-5'-triphosphate,3'-diphosphate pyrophosphatase
MQIGSVRLTERHIRSDPPANDDLLAVREDAERALEGAAAAVGSTSRDYVSVAGTATTVQAIALGLDRYDPERIHRSRLGLADVERVTASLARMTSEERAAVPVMTPGRGDVIVAGAVILAAAMRRFGFETTLVSETDILDGLALELIGS